MQPQPHGESGTAEIAENDPRERMALRRPAARWRLSDRAVLGLNLVLFLAMGTLLCFWFWRNTDWFEEFGAVLTFSGALSWLAMVLRIVPEGKVGSVQEIFFERVFESRRALPVHVVALGLVVAGTFCFATVQIEPFQESVERPVVVARIAGAAPAEDFWAEQLKAEEFDVLKPGQTLRVVVPVWWRTVRVVVAVGGFPEKTIALAPWERCELMAPSSFRWAAVLLRPTAGLMTEIGFAQQPLVLAVKRSRGDRTLDTKEMPLDGRPVWLGCGDHVEVPGWLRDEWGKEPGGAAHLGKWLFPTALWLSSGLEPGDMIAVEVRKPSGGKWELAKPQVVAPVPARAEFLPEVIRIGQ